MIAKGEVFDGCMMILSGILGVRPYTAIMEKWERCGYLPVVKYPVGTCVRLVNLLSM